MPNGELSLVGCLLVLLLVLVACWLPSDVLLLMKSLQREEQIPKPQETPTPRVLGVIKKIENGIKYSIKKHAASRLLMTKVFWHGEDDHHFEPPYRFRHTT